MDNREDLELYLEYMAYLKIMEMYVDCSDFDLLKENEK